MDEKDKAMKKIVRVELVAEVEVDTDWYDDKSEEGMIKIEENHFNEWILDEIVSHKISFRDLKRE